MWRSVRLGVLKSRISPSNSKKTQRHYSNDSSSKSTKIVSSVLTATGAGFAGAIVYGKYFDPEFKKTLEKNIPYVDSLFKWLPDIESKSTSSKSPSETKDSAISSGLLKKKIDREKEKISFLESQKSSVDSKDMSNKSGGDKLIEKSSLNPESKKSDESGLLSENQVNEALLSDLVDKLKASAEETLTAYKNAEEAVHRHTKSLYEALDVPEVSDSDMVWKDAEKTNTNKSAALKFAQEKASNTKAIADKLRINLRKQALKNPDHSLIKIGEESIAKIMKDLENAEAEISKVKDESKTATEYEKLLKESKEQFQKELQIVLPNYVHGVKGKTVTESDLNLLIAHAHRRIEQLQKQLAKQQVTEKLRLEEALRLQKIETENSKELKIGSELERQNVDLEAALSKRVASLKENFELELRKQLHRQAAAHADHIEEVLKVQEQELMRKYSLDLEEKLLHQKGVFVSEISGSMARLKGILAFLKAKSEFDRAAKKAQSLWLACQSMNEKISSESGSLNPLAKDLAAIKIAADEENSEFLNSVLAGVPSEAVNRGVYTAEVLKDRFHEVKKVCKKVALIDEKNDSLYRFILSYIQSLLIIDAVSIPKAEIQGKVAVYPKDWDNYAVLNRITYSLQVNDLEQALRYANQLQGEPRKCASDFIKELKILLETQLAVKALLAHAAAVGVQAYH